MLKKYWIIPVLTVYIYAATVLTQYGYFSFFNIPANFIESSIKENIIYFFQLFQMAMGIVGIMKWWMIAVFVAFVFLSAIYYGVHYKFRRYIVFGLSLLILFGFYKFGFIMASSSRQYNVLSSGCSGNSDDMIYVVPTFYGGQAVVVPVEKDSNKLLKGFTIKQINSLDCLIEYKTIDKLIK